jgi:murein DD-endopeptidase MepM/ murein hydrolase activator NlpD
MKSYPIPFPKGTEYKEIKNKLGKDKPLGYGFLSHERFLSTKYAKDLSVKIGTHVLAIEDGVVVSMKNDSDTYMNPKIHPRYKVLFEDESIKPLAIEVIEKLDNELMEFAGKYTNYVQVNQVDGSIAEYLHLDKNVQVDAKQKIMQGDVIGFVGMTGITTRPHLHLNIFENLSIPFELRER